MVDPSEAGPVLAALKETGWRLKHILNTHHHHDHIGGNNALKQATGAHIAGPEKDRHRIPDLETGLSEGAVYSVGTRKLRVLEVPGHTSGHIALVFDEDEAGVQRRHAVLARLRAGRSAFAPSAYRAPILRSADGRSRCLASATVASTS
ncbi:MAG: MBL fold metallo-hydrolase [Aliidongia sp.]